MLTTVTLKVTDNSRAGYRSKVTNEFLRELPGTGTGDSSSLYRYNVEKVQAHTVYLKRPTRLNKGFDFEIHVENCTFSSTRKPTMPKHTDILDDIAEKLEEDKTKGKELYRLIKRVYDCKPMPIKACKGLVFTSGLSVELLLKVIKWLFIEQDITYWNWSGREMFLTKIQETYAENNCTI